MDVWEGTMINEMVRDYQLVARGKDFPAERTRQTVTRPVLSAAAPQSRSRFGLTEKEKKARQARYMKKYNEKLKAKRAEARAEKEEKKPKRIPFTEEEKLARRRKAQREYQARVRMRRAEEEIAKARQIKGGKQ